VRVSGSNGHGGASCATNGASTPITPSPGRGASGVNSIYGGLAAPPARPGGVTLGHPPSPSVVQSSPAADGAFFDIEAPSPACLDPLRTAPAAASSPLHELLGAWPPSQPYEPEYHSATAFVPSPLSALASPGFGSPTLGNTTGPAPDGWVSFGGTGSSGGSYGDSSGFGAPSHSHTVSPMGTGAAAAAFSPPPAAAVATPPAAPAAVSKPTPPSLVDEMLARSLQGLGSR